MYNHKTIQRLFSNVCGNYYVYYILFCCGGIPMCTIISVFTTNLTENDRRVTQFIRDLPKR